MQEQALIRRNRTGITLFVIVAMTFMATLDSSIVNVVLPTMAEKMNVPLSSIEWVVASYSIIICSTLLFFGRLGDIIGKSNVFQWGTVLFTLASLLCGLCQSFTSLIICRFIQGIGASAYMANNQGIITSLFSKEGRGKALGILVASVALGTMIGPPAGGFIVSVLNWNFIFWINVPIGIAVFLMGLNYLPKSTRTNEQMDKMGATLQFGGTVLLFVALIEAQKIGFTNPYILMTILLSLLLIAWFIRFEKKQSQPLLELTIFINMHFSLNLICALTSFICIAASIILLPFYLQDTLKLTSAQTGLFMMISPFILAILSPLSGTLSDKIGSEIMSLIGLLFMGSGFFLMSRLYEHSSFVSCALSVSIMAVGQALFQPANNSLIMSASPRDKLGIVGSISSLVRNLGQIVGITLSTTLLYGFMSWKIRYPVSDYVKGRDDVFVYGMNHVYFILLAICCLGASLTAARLYHVKATSKR
ncbi:MFS transporter [Sporolactobacillus sp. STSJ-5]|uniref:MFS transporter n=1 Tax=Sporolactobacillus sp. STSJ-5 TaxID=2965076 RepID=UPI0021027B44|nr:MFS transporter [Sporolactobacillus sp. STSJ-5]MCQ2011550.1 MFS transporter [Sporolactobacillus sp. STSJ-5]